MKQFSIYLSLVLFLYSFEARAQQQNTNWSVDWSNPKVFIENKGQFRLPHEKQGAQSEVLFGIDDGGTMIYFTKKGLTYSFFQRDKEKVVLDKSQYATLEEYKKAKASFKMSVKSDLISMNWEGASSAVRVNGEVESGMGHTYVIKVNDANVEVAEIKSYHSITYSNLYPGIDVKYIFHPETGIKYDIILNPGADPSLLRMVYVGADGLSLSSEGDLHIQTVFGDIIDHAPYTLYPEAKQPHITSSYQLNGNTVSFVLGKYDINRKIIIDPWTVNPAFPNSNKIWECEKDAAGNAYIYGGDTPMRLRKYNATGTLQWTYNSSWDTSGFWVGTFIVDQAGNSYITSGSNGEIRKVNTGGTSVWYNNPNGFFGPIYEYWHLTFNCDETQLICGGMRAQSPLSINSYRGAIMNINLNTGAILGTPLTVGWMAGLTIKEVRTICSSPNQNYYFLTLDSVGMMTNTLTLGWKNTSGYNFGYGIPNYGVTNQGISAIRATGSFIYTQNGSTLHKRNIANGTIVGTVAIPGGQSTTQFGSSTPHNSGLDLDNCGNVYVGSTTGVHKFDANLTLLGSALTSNAVYDVAVSPSGEVLACGNGFFSSINTLAPCGVVQVICSSNPLSISTSQTNPLCNGVCTGTATVSPSGGTAPYTILWSNSQTTATATGLCAGTYTVTVTDAGPTTVTATVTITQPPVITASATSTPANCGNNNGTASATASGGTGTLTYNWTPSGGTNANATGLSGGVYTVTVTDANGCTMTATTTVGSSGGPIVTLSTQQNVLCFGNSTGSATVNVTGGNSPYTYSWSPSGGTNATATGLSSGTYTITVTDATPCSQTFTVTITQPAVLANTTGSTNTSCGATTGTVSSNVTGGTGPYTYLWSPGGATTANVSNLGAGTYTVQVTDVNGCSLTSTAIVNNLNGPNSAVSAQSNASCFGSANGNATIGVTGGTAPYTFLWSPSGGTAASASGLTAGTYTVTVTDANGCTSTITVTITQPTVLSLSLNGTDASCGFNNGSVSSTISGGSPGYFFLWQPGGATTSGVSGLAAGTYTCVVTDANGCSTTTAVTITSSPGLNVTISNDTAISVGQSAQLTSGTGVTYNWSPSTGLSCTTCANPVASPTVTTTYTVVITDASGCTGLAMVTVTILNQCGDNGEFFIPDAFSPNSDLTNDVLFVRGGGISEFFFAVYDRWGEKVFESTDPTIGWDGTYKSRPLDPAVFVYYLKITCFAGEEIIQKGNVTLFR